MPWVARVTALMHSTAASSPGSGLLSRNASSAGCLLEDRVQPLGDDLVLAGLEHEDGDEHALVAGAVDAPDQDGRGPPARSFVSRSRVTFTRRSSQVSCRCGTALATGGTPRFATNVGTPFRALSMTPSRRSHSRHSALWSRRT